MAGPTDEATLERVGHESGAVSELKKHSKEYSVTDSDSNAVTSELDDTPLKSDSNNGSSDEPTTVVPQSVVKDDLNAFCEPIQLNSSPKESRDFTDISQPEEHVPDIEKEKERLSSSHQEDDRLSDTFNPSLLGYTAAESVDGSHPDFTDALCDPDDTVHRSSSESLDESMRPHSSLFSPHPFTTSTPRPRISSTPCSGAQRPHVPYSGSTEGPFSNPAASSSSKSYDYLLKVLLVGDSDVGKQEIITGMEDGSMDSVYCTSTGAAYKTTIILIDGKKVKLHIWDTSGQGRFCTIIRSYSRGAQGILLVYDITNRWSFNGMDRWVREVEEHAPGIPKVLVGNRKHLEFKRQVDSVEAETYAERHNMGFYEISPLANFNITESFQELCRMALKRNGMERLWRSNRVLTLQELCCHAIVGRTNGYGIDKLPLPDAIKANLKSYAMTSYPVKHGRKSMKERKKRTRPPDASGANCVSFSRKSCVIS